MPRSAYIHIPFCKSKCKYCSFVSFVNEERKTGYIYALLKDIDSNYSGEKLQTLYFGGGTPSLIETKLLDNLIKQFNLENNCEVTLEMNPDDSDLNYLKSLKDIGINRISMGAQTFDDIVLRQIGRRHSAEDIKKAVKNAKEAGFENISLDLIYGLWGDIDRDVDEILKLDIQHVSTYGLKIEEGSYFYNHVPSHLPDDDMQADMYLLINKKLEEAGFRRYEVSNFALPGFESKHNLNYWNNEEYYGFGAAAHGYSDGIRYSNFQTLDKYMHNPAVHETGHCLSRQEMLEEEIFLGFRKEDGININLINDKYGINFNEKYNAILEKYCPKYIEGTPSGYKLTLEGVLLSNNILCEFLS